jgi:hypothetical protein
MKLKLDAIKTAALGRDKVIYYKYSMLLQTPRVYRTSALTIPFIAPVPGIYSHFTKYIQIIVYNETSTRFHLLCKLRKYDI